eukprot:1140731-Pelagomonas_calceolata.AAC.6
MCDMDAISNCLPQLDSRLEYQCCNNHTQEVVSGVCPTVGKCSSLAAGPGTLSVQNVTVTVP